MKKKENNLPPDIGPDETPFGILRKTMNLTIKELAKKLEIAPATISDIEHKKTLYTRKDIIKKYHDFFKVSYEFLFSDSYEFLFVDKKGNLIKDDKERNLSRNKDEILTIHDILGLSDNAIKTLERLKQSSGIIALINEYLGQGVQTETFFLNTYEHIYHVYNLACNLNELKPDDPNYEEIKSAIKWQLTYESNAFEDFIVKYYTDIGFKLSEEFKKRRENEQDLALAEAKELEKQKQESSLEIKVIPVENH